MLIPSPDGCYMARIDPRSLQVLITDSGERLLSIPLQISCPLAAWDESSSPSEYRLAVAGQSQVLSVCFSASEHSFLMVCSNGSAKHLQWTPMISQRGKLMVRLACHFSAPDTAQIWSGSTISCQVLRPKSGFVLLPSLNGWAILHTANTADKVTFIANGRFFSGIVLPSATSHSIVPCLDCPLVAVADGSSLYIVGPTRIIARLQDMVVEQLVWMKGGDIIVLAQTGIFCISPTLRIKSKINCQSSRRVHAILDKQVVEVTNGFKFELVSPVLFLSKSGEYCAIQSSQAHVVVIVCATGEEEPITIDYRDSLAQVNWYEDTFYIRFEDFGVYWAAGSFGVVDFRLEKVKGFMVQENRAIMWSEETFTTSELALPRNKDHFEMAPVATERNENYELARPPPLSLTPALQKLAPLHLPSISPYLDDYMPEDTFHYKRLK